VERKAGERHLPSTCDGGNGQVMLPEPCSVWHTYRTENCLLLVLHLGAMCCAELKCFRTFNSRREGTEPELFQSVRMFNSYYILQLFLRTANGEKGKNWVSPRPPEKCAAHMHVAVQSRESPRSSVTLT
jgi:hypothetical protein